MGKFIPLGNTVLCELVELNDSPIILPDRHTEKGAKVFRIIEVGKGLLNDDGSYIPIDLKVGDEIIFQLESAAKVESKTMYPGRELWLVKVPMIMMKVDRSDDDGVIAAGKAKLIPSGADC